MDKARGCHKLRAGNLNDHSGLSEEKGLWALGSQE